MALAGISPSVYSAALKRHQLHSSVISCVSIDSSPKKVRITCKSNTALVNQIWQLTRFHHHSWDDTILISTVFHKVHHQEVIYLTHGLPLIITLSLSILLMIYEQIMAQIILIRRANHLQKHAQLKRSTFYETNGILSCFTRLQFASFSKWYIASLMMTSLTYTDNSPSVDEFYSQ